MKYNKMIVLSLGGSLIAPKTGFDLKFLKSFQSFILKQIKNGFRFVIVCGGGNTARVYQKTGREMKLRANDLDWLGIYATWLNADFVRLLFGRLAHEKIVKNISDKFNWQEPLLFSGGWQPGHSTDFDAVQLAQVYGAKLVINLSNIDYVFDEDPHKFKDAKKIEKISWTDFRKIVGDKWVPGANLPFDPIASREAQEHKIKVAVVRGDNLAEVEKALLDKNFKGTLIE